MIANVFDQQVRPNGPKGEIRDRLRQTAKGLLRRIKIFRVGDPHRDIIVRGAQFRIFANVRVAKRLTRFRPQRLHPLRHHVFDVNLDQQMRAAPQVEAKVHHIGGRP